MGFDEFMKNFKSLPELMKEDPNKFVQHIHNGIFIKNDDCMRIEYLQKGEVVAWLSYDSLLENPDENFKNFIRYRLLR